MGSILCKPRASEAQIDSDFSQSSTDPIANLDPYEYVTHCRPRADLIAENDAKPAKQRLKQGELLKRNSCDGGTDCMCDKVGRPFVFGPFLVVVVV